MLPGLLAAAKRHHGTSFVEIMQNCLVYNDGVFAGFTEKNIAADRQVICEHGKKLIFGGGGNKGLRLKTGMIELEAVTIGENGVGEDDILVHDETNRMIAGLLARMQHPEFPMPIGVFYCDPAKPYDQAVLEQDAAIAEKSPPGDLNALLRKGRTWTVAPS